MPGAETSFKRAKQQPNPRPLIVYLDTNVFSFIAKTDESKEAEDVLKGHQALVGASDSQLSETFGIRDPERRAAELRVITRLTKRHLPPASFSHAMELLGEMRRLRPEWLRRHPDTTRIQPILNLRKRMWAQARLHPDRAFPGFELYQQDSERGIAKHEEGQKGVRNVRTRGSGSMPMGQLHFEYESAIAGKITIEDGDIVGYWRLHGLTIWYLALVNKVPESRDYLDWMRPYLRQLKFERADWEQFWRDVESARMPKDFLTAIVDYYQTHHKVTHGNATDSLHANHLLDCSLFLTADRSFFSVLQEVRLHFPDAADVALVEQRHRRASEGSIGIGRSPPQSPRVVSGLGDIP